MILDSLTTDPFEEDGLKEECGVFAVFDNSEAGKLTVLGLHSLQHRGQDACGIVTFDDETGQFHAHREMGKVGDVFGEAKRHQPSKTKNGSGKRQVGENIMDEAAHEKTDVILQLQGKNAIGHVRYGTAGGSAARNIQPMYANLDFGGFALAHNGHITNASLLRQSLTKSAAIFQSTMDTEVLLHGIARAPDAGKGKVGRIIDALRTVEGAFSIVTLLEDCILGARDPHGFRPLVIGKLNQSYILASETCALDIIGADYIRDVEPGEVVIIDDKGLRSRMPFERRVPRPCVFEYIYFARPDSTINGYSVYEARKNIGKELAKESPAKGDIVVPVPDSGVPSAIGYSQASGIPFELGIIRNHHVGRTFIQPGQENRTNKVKLKLNASTQTIKDKRVILVDDSIVRGTTSAHIVKMVREAGAAEVHMRIASPPTKHPCFYGIDTPDQSALIAHRFSVEEIAEKLGVDSLAFISFDGLYCAMGEGQGRGEAPKFCDACFTGDYPTQLRDRDANLLD